MLWGKEHLGEVGKAEDWVRVSVFPASALQEAAGEATSLTERTPISQPQLQGWGAGHPAICLVCLEDGHLGCGLPVPLTLGPVLPLPGGR